MSAKTTALWQDTFASLKHNNYRLWFYGQIVSLVGTWMQSTAQGYLVYQLTGSPAYLGLVGFIGGLPSLLFTLLGGVAADRLPRRNLLVVTQTAMMILAFILAALTFANLVQPWHILILAFLLGVANAFDAPARVSFVLELVIREDMTNAIALNSTMFNIATIIGPSVAGLTYAALGPAWCFTLNGISFIAVIVALLLMRLKPFVPPPRHGSTLNDLTVGLRYVFADRLILTLTGSAGLVGILALGMMTLLPAWAKDILHGDVTTNGWLIAARGVGSLIGALMLASLGKRKIRGKLWTVGSFVMPLLLLFFAVLRWLPFSLIALVGIGWSVMLIINNNNAMIQSRVEDDVRGRVMSVYTLVFFGAMPLGSLIAGAVAEKFSEPLTVLMSAIILAGFSVAAWAFLPYVRKQE
ncbi:MAG: MFS transporter [Anaerolineales bacterium]|nr:MFS transporter [Anaerolineales bacterium]